MAYNLTRKNIESFIENNDTRRILEIYSESTSKEKADVMDKFIKADGYRLDHEQMVKLASSDIANAIRELDRDSLEKSFKPMKEESNSRFLKSGYKDKLSTQTFTTLKQIYNTNKDDCYLGLCNIQYVVDYYLENGIMFGKKAEFQKQVKIVNGFDVMINQISSCDVGRQSYGSLIIKVPKDAIDKKNMPIYYLKEGFIYLNPEYVICYVPVKNGKLLDVEINRSMNEVESTIYEGDSLDLDREVIHRRTL